MKHGYFCKANSCPTSQKSTRLLQNKKSLCRVHKTATLVPVEPDKFSQNPDIKMPPMLFKIHIGLIENPRNLFAEAGKLINGA